MATLETVTVQGDGISVDLIVYRRFKRPMPGMVERIFELNRGLADAGLFLPIGTKLLIPIDAPKKTPDEKPAVRIWD